MFLGGYFSKYPLLSGRDHVSENNRRKKILNEFNNQWKTLWRDLVVKIHAEEIANRDFPLLFVEQGTVVKASRGIRQLPVGLQQRGHS